MPVRSRFPFVRLSVFDFGLSLRKQFIVRDFKPRNLFPWIVVFSAVGVIHGRFEISETPARFCTV